jgi:hypothetical protein
MQRNFFIGLTSCGKYSGPRKEVLYDYDLSSEALFIGEAGLSSPPQIGPRCVNAFQKTARTGSPRAKYGFFGEKGESRRRY